VAAVKLLIVTNARWGAWSNTSANKTPVLLTSAWRRGASRFLKLELRFTKIKGMGNMVQQAT
jgi:hypothetical protein